MKLHASGEDYLEAILVLHKKMGMVRSVDVARHLEVTKPSAVSYTHLGLPKLWGNLNTLDIPFLW